MQVIWRVVTRPSVSYLLELKLVIALLPRMIITGSHLYIWVEKGTRRDDNAIVFRSDLSGGQPTNHKARPCYALGSCFCIESKCVTTLHVHFNLS